MAGEKDKKNTVKLVIAVVALVIGGGLILNTLGAFDSFLEKPRPAPVLAPELQKEHEEQKAKLKKQIENKEIPPPAGA